MPAPQPAPGAGALELQRRIAAAEQIVAQDPKNVQAWVQLGNDYFDTQQRQKAIDAYQHALELKPDDPNVLTDQGVMFREVGQFDRAVANFQKANQVDPSHMQSLYNLGVVQAYDLNQADKAIQTWNRVIEKNPMSPQAAQARQAIDDVRRRAGGPAGK
jgi:cytochrome c-type biogenesis protein CcmH/NrfG